MCRGFAHSPKPLAEGARALQTVHAAEQQQFSDTNRAVRSRAEHGATLSTNPTQIDLAHGLPTPGADIEPLRANFCSRRKRREHPHGAGEPIIARRPHVGRVEMLPLERVLWFPPKRYPLILVDATVGRSATTHEACYVRLHSHRGLLVDAPSDCAVLEPDLRRMPLVGL